MYLQRSKDEKVAAVMLDIRKLIRDYTASVGESFAELLVVFPSFDMRPLGLRIPRSGTLPSGRTYFFHGIGCRFRKEGQTTDMDFGPEGRIDGFDAWRLNSFAQSNGLSDCSIERIQTALDGLLKAGAIVKSDRSDLGSHLYFPVEAISF